MWETTTMPFQSQTTNIETIYYNDITICTEKVALSTLFKRKKQSLSAHSLVKEAQKTVIAARKQHQDKPPKASLRKFSQAQRQLDEAYANAEAENIQGKIDRVPLKNAVHRHASAWDTIKDLTERKSKPSIRIKGGSRSERKKNWPDHFKNLLGATLTSSEEQELPRIQSADALIISMEPFSIEELKAVASTLKVQKSPGLVNIPALSLQWLIAAQL